VILNPLIRENPIKLEFIMNKVDVTWIDAWGDDAQLELEAVANFVPVKRRNRGLLIKHDEDKIIITQGTIENLFAGKTFVDGVVVIPKGMIQAIELEKDD